VEITESDLQKAFERNYGPRVKARVIMIDNLRRGNEVWEMAKKNPANFEQLAQDHSIDPNSRALGGQVPPIPRYTGAEKLEQEAFRLKEGDISGVIEIGPSRYVILKCEGRTTPVVDNIDEVRDTLYDELKEAKTQQAVGKVFEKIKESTRVDNYYARTTSGPDTIVPVSAQGNAPGGATAPAGAAPRTARPSTGIPATSGAGPRTSRN
jgi:foldase protein PrsA